MPLFTVSVRLLIILLLSSIVRDAIAASMCATSTEKSQVRAALEGREPAPLGMVAASLKLPESLVASALPATQAHGVGAEHFQVIWRSIERWSDATTFITKGPNLFEIHGTVGRGEPSKRSSFFNIDREGPGLAGHLRPDLYSSIYVLQIPGTSSTLRGVVFFDLAGDSVFSVFVPGEGKPAPPKVIREFEATEDLIRKLSPICP